MTARRIALALVLAAGACKAVGRTQSAADAESTTAPADPLADAELQIADNATRMRALGIEVPDTVDRDARERPRLEEAPKQEPEVTGPQPQPTGDVVTPSTPTSPAPKPAVAPKVDAPTDSPPEKAPTPSSTPVSRRVDRCGQICELAQVACGLEQQVCRLAELHVGEPRYEDACWRARDQCERGQDACDECSAAC